MFFKKYADNKNPNSQSFQLRQRRFAKFCSLCGINNNSTILDVGGTVDIWLGTGFEKNVTLSKAKML